MGILIEQMLTVGVVLHERNACEVMIKLHAVELEEFANDVEDSLFKQSFVRSNEGHNQDY